MKNDYMNISVVRISLFVSNNYNMVVIYQPYTSIKYARYITILNTVDIDSTNPKRLRIRNPREKVSLIYYFYTIYITCIQRTTLVKNHISTSLKTHLITCFGRW